MCHTNPRIPYFTPTILQVSRRLLEPYPIMLLTNGHYHKIMKITTLPQSIKRHLNWFVTKLTKYNIREMSNSFKYWLVTSVYLPYNHHYLAHQYNHWSYNITTIRTVFNFLLFSTIDNTSRWKIQIQISEKVHPWWSNKGLKVKSSFQQSFTKCFFTEQATKTTSTKRSVQLNILFETHRPGLLNEGSATSSSAFSSTW